MSHTRHLPIWKAAFDLAVHLEHAVRRFPRYHKYTLGTELRQTGATSVLPSAVAIRPEHCNFPPFCFLARLLLTVVI